MDTPLTLSPWSGDAPTLDAIKKIYHDSFPAEEQRPWADLESRARQRRGLCLLTIHTGERLAGFITIWDLGLFLYIEHFAVDASMRGANIGSKAIAAAMARSDKPLLLEVEREEEGEMARRRIGFYRRCGFTPLDYDYVQPPYSPGQPEVPLTLMCTDPGIDAALAASMLHAQIYASEPKHRK